jgi:hypothetical protein
VADKLTGKASYVNYNGTTLYITKYSLKGSRTLVDTSDSADYDQSTDIIHASQLASKVSSDLTVEGYYHKSQTNAAVIAVLYNGAEAVPVVLGLDAGAKLGHGNFDIQDFSADVPLEDKVGWSATLKSNGKFTPGS